MIKALATGIAWFLLILAPGAVYTYGVDGSGPTWFSLLTIVEMLAAITVGVLRGQTVWLTRRYPTVSPSEYGFRTMWRDWRHP